MKSHHATQLTEADLLDDFKKAAWETTERVAVNIVGNEHGLLDVEGNPKSKRAAVLIAKSR